MPSQTTKEEGELLSDWGSVESHVRGQDKVMINDFNDDINTLLVFAGLFSAVLTAFVIESYQWLQDDPADVSAQLLFQISQQLAALGNASHPALAPPHVIPSTVSAASIWINVLWFFSLVLSLGSALFGMIAKQWLREYISWTTSSSVARELMLLRQIRLKAWKDWNVPLIISTIPALLELALMLFLGGMDILLWTLDNVVASIVTVAVSVLILGAFTVTVLPTFAPKCPYRSPLAWGCLLFYNRISKLATPLAVLLRPFGVSSPRVTSEIPIAGDWRSRDFMEVLPAKVPIRARWFLELTNVGTREYMAAVKDSETLLRSLILVSSNTWDHRLISEVHKSCGLIHRSDFEPRSKLLGAALHAVCNVCDINPTSLANLSAAMYARIAPENLRPPIYICRTIQEDSINSAVLMAVERKIEVLPKPTLEIVSQYLGQSVHQFLMSILNTPKDLSDAHPSSDKPLLRQLQALASILAFFVFTSNTRRSFASHFDTGNHEYPCKAYEWLCSTLSWFSDRIASDIHVARRFPGLKAMLLDVMCQLATVDIQPYTNVIIAKPGKISEKPQCYANLAIQSYERVVRLGDDEFNELLADERHTFVMLASRAIAASATKLEPHQTFFTLFFIMGQYSKHAYEKKLTNLGCYTHFPWIDDLASLAKNEGETRSDITTYFQWLPPIFFNSLKLCIRRGLITHPSATTQFTQLQYLYDKLGPVDLFPISDAHGHPVTLVEDPVRPRPTSEAPTLLSILDINELFRRSSSLETPVQPYNSASSDLESSENIGFDDDELTRSRTSTPYQGHLAFYPTSAASDVATAEESSPASVAVEVGEGAPTIGEPWANHASAAQSHGQPGSSERPVRLGEGRRNGMRGLSNTNTPTSIMRTRANNSDDSRQRRSAGTVTFSLPRTSIGLPGNTNGQWVTTSLPATYPQWGWANASSPYVQNEYPPFGGVQVAGPYPPSQHRLTSPAGAYRQGTMARSRRVGPYTVLDLLTPSTSRPVSVVAQGVASQSTSQSDRPYSPQQQPANNPPAIVQSSSVGSSTLISREASATDPVNNAPPVIPPYFRQMSSSSSSSHFGPPEGHLISYDYSGFPNAGPDEPASSPSRTLAGDTISSNLHPQSVPSANAPPSPDSEPLPMPIWARSSWQSTPPQDTVLELSTQADTPLGFMPSALRAPYASQHARASSFTATRPDVAALGITRPFSAPSGDTPLSAVGLVRYPWMETPAVEHPALNHTASQTDPERTENHVGSLGEREFSSEWLIQPVPTHSRTQDVPLAPRARLSPLPQQRPTSEDSDSDTSLGSSELLRPPSLDHALQNRVPHPEEANHVSTSLGLDPSTMRPAQHRQPTMD